MDDWSRRIIGWSIAPHIHTELVLDALGMAPIRRTPKPKETILHSDPRIAIHIHRHGAPSGPFSLDAAGGSTLSSARIRAFVVCPSEVCSAGSQRSWLSLPTETTAVISEERTMAVDAAPDVRTRTWLTKVPAITATFWVIKVLSTTIGETFA